MKTYAHLWQYPAWFFLEWEMFQTKVVERIKTLILCSITFFRKLCRLWGNVEKYFRAGQATDDNMAPAHCIAHSEYLILIACPVQQWLRARTSVVRLYLHCLSFCKASTPQIKSRRSVTFLGITFHKNVPTVLLFSSKTVLIAHNFENTTYSVSIPGFRRTKLGISREKVEYLRKKKIKCLETFQISLKISQEFLPGNLQCQSNLCALPTASMFSIPSTFLSLRVPQYRKCYFRVRQWKKGCETLPHTSKFVSYFVYVKNMTRSEKGT
jgi:hypothetical protein